MLPGLSSAIFGIGLPPFGYRATYEDLTAQTTYSFASSDFGQPHLSRLVIVATTAVAGATRTVASMTIGGVAATLAVGTGAAIVNFEIWYALVPTGNTGTVAVTWNAACTASLIHVWSGYPASATPVDAVADTSFPGATSDIANLAKTVGGFAVFATRTSGANTVALTQTGAETIVENMDTTKLGGSIGIGAMSFVVTATTTTDDFTATFSASANCNLVGATWA